MAHYRFYTLDSAGSIVDGQDCDFSTDAAALDAAADRAGRNGIAVWQGVRHVGSIGSTMKPQERGLFKSGER